MHALDILVGQIQRKQEYESMGMVQALKTIAEKKSKDKINKVYEKGKRKYVIFTINWILFKIYQYLVNCLGKKRKKILKMIKKPLKMYN